MFIRSPRCPHRLRRTGSLCVGIAKPNASPKRTQTRADRRSIASLAMAGAARWRATTLNEYAVVRRSCVRTEPPETLVSPIGTYEAVAHQRLELVSCPSD